MDTSAPTSKALKLIILSSALAAFMSSLDGTIVNIALPTISDIFDLPSSSVAWVSTIYLLVMAGSLLVVGKLTDSNDRIIRNEDEVRYMDRPRTDEIYKL